MDSTTSGTHGLDVSPTLVTARDATQGPSPREGGSGSRLLGEFVRKLRGSRSLQAIEDLSKSPPLAGRTRPADVSTLSKIETGKQFPSLTTLLSLEQIYEVPIQRFLDHVKLERYWGLRPDANDYEAAMTDGHASGDRGDFPKSY